MGSTVPKVVEDEKTNWVADHCLQINVERRDRQLQSVGKFGEQLHICWSRCQQNGIRYNHFFVTDLVHTMEFLTTGLQVHSNALQAPYYVDASFAKTSEVEHRMKQVCGSMAYSVSLRNCEHLARYIHSGSWVSYQMLQGSYLGSTFVQYMMDEHMKKSNCLPGELRVEAPRRQLYSSRDYAGFLKYESSPRGLSRADHDAFNVLVVGPSGCGKSKLINLLFNSDVTESKGAAHSVTREMKVLSGQGKIYDSIRKVNIIDTIGLCDSHISARMVLELIKSSLKVNFAYIDQVVVICSGRIEAIHTESITQTLEWLRYKDYRYSFTFVYNKADLLAPSERELGVIHMCQLLQVKRLVFTYPLGNFVAGDVMRHHIEPRPGVVTRAKCVSTGFPEGQESEHVIEEMCKVVDSQSFSTVFWALNGVVGAQTVPFALVRGRRSTALYHIKCCTKAFLTAGNS
ncbi:spn2 [Symbiodinium sp. KB8]|nr:spn2 [Symbiodinium sp. KB8]